MTSLDNLEKQLAFLKNSMENLDQPKVEEVQESDIQEKTRTGDVSIYTPPPTVLSGTENAAAIKSMILKLIGASPLAQNLLPNSVQGYINKIHNDLDIEKKKAAVPVAPTGPTQTELNAIRDKDAAIKAHKDDLKAIYTALAGLTKPPV